MTGGPGLISGRFINGSIYCNMICVTVRLLDVSTLYTFMLMFTGYPTKLIVVFARPINLIGRALTTTSKLVGEPMSYVPKENQVPWGRVMVVVWCVRLAPVLTVCAVAS
jgi:hypothetical protein